MIAAYRFEKSPVSRLFPRRKTLIVRRCAILCRIQNISSLFHECVRLNVRSGGKLCRTGSNPAPAPSCAGATGAARAGATISGPSAAARRAGESAPVAGNSSASPPLRAAHAAKRRAGISRPSMTLQR
ncbi:hypothetical protein [Lysobacter gummosus]|uniref:hypothetical protein n=1 Tax=Lysobacter gummosus TaxID=262324 RepID=UPI003626F8EE